MLVNIINNDTGLSREVWALSLYKRSSYNFILWLDKYYYETRETKRHKYKVESKWVRTIHGDSNIQPPIVPEFVVLRAKEEYKNIIDSLEVSYH